MCPTSELISTSLKCLNPKSHLRLKANSFSCDPVRQEHDSLHPLTHGRFKIDSTPITEEETLV